MIDLFPDWNSIGRWGSCVGLPSLLAGDALTPPALPRYVLRWLCQHCERGYLGTAPAPQYCHECRMPLTFVAQWDLMKERAPRWWRDPGELP
jgi:hypothetical protein